MLAIARPGASVFEADSPRAKGIEARAPQALPDIFVGRGSGHLIVLAIEDRSGGS